MVEKWRTTAINTKRYNAILDKHRYFRADASDWTAGFAGGLVDSHNATLSHPPNNTENLLKTQKSRQLGETRILTET